MSPIDFVQEILCLSPVLNYRAASRSEKSQPGTFSMIKDLISKLVRYVQFGGHSGDAFPCQTKRELEGSQYGSVENSSSVRRQEAGVQYLNVLEHKKDKFST